MLKKILPHSLFGRFLLIILLPNIIVQLVTVYIFYERHWSGVSKHMATALAGDVAFIVKAIESESLIERDVMLKIASDNMYLDLKFKEGAKLDSSKKQVADKFEILRELLSGIIKNEYLIYYIDERLNLGVDVQLTNGVLEIYTSKKRIDNPSTYIFIMWMMGTAIIFLIISIFFMRNQVRSISQIANVADKFGKGEDTENFKPSGATEVRQVAQAFIQMRERINRQIEQRTEMLAGVSHDLRTPLTRLKLQLAMLPQSKEIKESQEDITEMEKMIQDYLDFAKGKEKTVDSSVNISDIMNNIVSVYRNQHSQKTIELQVEADIIIRINSNSFRRIITNLVENALRYGTKVQITANKLQDELIITMDDNGIGIPLEKRELVFKPFYKIDESRHLESGSTGLGLAIAKDIITGYKGEISLEESFLGGLRVLVKLPIYNSP
jgi:two-component system osmolarity sensor histidine kinase EnvZ